MPSRVRTVRQRSLFDADSANERASIGNRCQPQLMPGVARRRTPYLDRNSSLWPVGCITLDIGRFLPQESILPLAVESDAINLLPPCETVRSGSELSLRPVYEGRRKVHAAWADEAMLGLYGGLRCDIRARKARYSLKTCLYGMTVFRRVGKRTQIGRKRDKTKHRWHPGKAK